MQDAGCWGWVGKEFTVNGSGSDTATIVADASISGTIWSASNAASKVKSDFRIYNITDDFTQETSIVDETVSNNIIGEQDVVGDYSKAMTVNLQAGKRYRVVTSLRTAGSVGLAGGCTSDFGPNLDINNLDREELHLRNFSIIF